MIYVELSTELYADTVKYDGHLYEVRPHGAGYLMEAVGWDARLAAEVDTIDPDTVIKAAFGDDYTD